MACTLWCQASLGAQEVSTLTVGLFMDRPATVLLRQYAPLRTPLKTELERHLKVPVKVVFRTFRSQRGARIALRERQISALVICMPGYAHLARYRTVRRVVDVPLSGSALPAKANAIIVPVDSPIQELKHLKEQRIAMGPLYVGASSIMLSAHLEAHGYRTADFPLIDRVTRHDQLFHAVRLGTYDAGGLPMADLRRFDPSGQKVRIIGRYAGQGSAWVVHRDCEQRVFLALQQALLKQHSPAWNFVMPKADLLDQAQDALRAAKVFRASRKSVPPRQGADSDG